MAYQAKVIPIMVASPGDVREERRIVREVLHDWNDVNASSSGVVLTPVGWDTHSSPEMGTRPQDLINTRVLKDCDLLIAVFWTRLGTPTGVAPSGTVEEIREHISAGKPAMLYFSSRPVAPESIDAAQYRLLQSFRAECETQGLIETYDDPDEFRRKLSKQLQLTLLHNEFLRALLKSPPELSTPDNSIATETRNRIMLSDDATSILRAAKLDSSGTIINVRTLGGHYIQAGSEKFGGSYGRESANWESALQELVENALVIERGYKGEVFELTALGWGVADEL